MSVIPIGETIAACVNCSSELKRIPALEAESAYLRVENMRLRARIVHIHNHELHDIRNEIADLFVRWLPKVRAANRAALFPKDQDNTT